MSTQKLTKSFLEKVEKPEKGQKFYRDSELKGFGLRVTSGGAKSLILEKRIDGKVKRITLGRYPEISPDRARKFATELLGEIAVGVNPIAKRKADKLAGLTLIEVYNDYKKFKSDLAASTFHQYDMFLDLKLKDWLNKPLKSITKSMVVERHNDLKKVVSPSYANVVMRVLSALFKFAKHQYEDEKGFPLFPFNPVEQITHIKGWAKEPRRQNIIKQSDMKNWYASIYKLKRETTSHNIYVCCDFVVFLLLTGLRLNEGSLLKWEHVDFNDNSFHIPITKNKEPLTLPMSDLVKSILLYRESEKINDYVFPSQHGDGSLYRSTKLMRKINSESGIHHTFHDLRRTFITIADSLDISSFAIKKLVNHSSGSDVTSGYIISSTDRLRSPMQRITDFVAEHCEIDLSHFAINA